MHPPVSSALLCGWLCSLSGAETLRLYASRLSLLAYCIRQATGGKSTSGTNTVAVLWLLGLKKSPDFALVVRL
jgi:hypothetical protein